MSSLYFFFGVMAPYAAITIFVLGLIYRVLRWASIPVPFCIPTTCGQQKSLSWIKTDDLENPHDATGVVGRMIFEVFLFRSLFRNTKAELKAGTGKLIYGGSKYLWLAALVFHWSLLIILIRHLSLLTEPIPSFLLLLQQFDGLFEFTVPNVFLTDALITAALSFLFLRRVLNARIRYISLPADYLAILLLLAVAISGIAMRLIFRVDVVGVKEFALGLLTFRPSIPPESVGLAFYIHLFLVSTLLAYFPFSKLVHMAGVFLSPTRNLANDSRMRRHVNPWDYSVKVHTYAEWEDEFRDVMKAAGLPLEKES